MPDRISNFRTIRLALHPSTDGERVSWALLATSTRRGVPNARILASGEMLTPGGVSDEYAIWVALQALVSSEVRT
jgi:hypothetical protein